VAGQGRSEKFMHLHTEDDIYYVQNYSSAKPARKGAGWIFIF